MYYVNKEQINLRINCIPMISSAMKDLLQQWSTGNVLHALAQERLLHLAIETITDIGSYMIDGLMMRDASSYEDIIGVLHGEGVFSAHVSEVLIELVKLRKPLVQDYYDFDRTQIHPLITVLPEILSEFAEKSQSYLDKELEGFEG